MDQNPPLERPNPLGLRDPDTGVVVLARSALIEFASYTLPLGVRLIWGREHGHVSVQWQQLLDVDGNGRPGLVHRLDQSTEISPEKRPLRGQPGVLWGEQQGRLDKAAKARITRFDRTEARDLPPEPPRCWQWGLIQAPPPAALWPSGQHLWVS